MQRLIKLLSFHVLVTLDWLVRRLYFFSQSAKMQFGLACFATWHWAKHRSFGCFQSNKDTLLWGYAPQHFLVFAIENLEVVFTWKFQRQRKIWPLALQWRDWSAGDCEWWCSWCVQFGSGPRWVCQVGLSIAESCDFKLNPFPGFLPLVKNILSLETSFSTSSAVFLTPSNLLSQVAGFGARGGCYDPAAVTCNACAPPSYCTSTTLADAEASHLLVEDSRAKSQGTRNYERDRNLCYNFHGVVERWTDSIMTNCCMKTW